MRKKRITDATGTPLIPSKQGCECPGNGEHPEYECCCDECGYLLCCLDPEIQLKRSMCTDRACPWTGKSVSLSDGV